MVREIFRGSAVASRPVVGEERASGASPTDATAAVPRSHDRRVIFIPKAWR
jgi:hypothetical protein